MINKSLKMLEARDIFCVFRYTLIVNATKKFYAVTFKGNITGIPEFIIILRHVKRIFKWIIRAKMQVKNNCAISENEKLS